MNDAGSDAGPRLVPHPRHPVAVELIAHRGMPRKAPENTLAGFVLAIGAGADGVEFDVHATADDVVVVHHDAVLPPEPGSPHGVYGSAIRSLTLAQLRHETSAGVEIPTLDEALDCLGSRAIAYVEIKAPGIEPLVVAALRRHAHRLGGAPLRAAVHGFDHRVALHTRALAPDIPTGILASSYLVAPEQALRAAEARDYWQWWEMIDRPLVERIHAAGGRVIAWTVNNTGDAAHLRTLGVDAVCSDVPDVIGAFLRLYAREGDPSRP